jgi:hypothetical protein
MDGWMDGWMGVKYSLMEWITKSQNKKENSSSQYFNPLITVHFSRQKMMPKISPEIISFRNFLSAKYSL